ncbi:hypothetical protein N1031_06855 [Herbiconiux moechotypicola]|uniref:Uncharacterized protein n=1 Tax=Herbiconiux moechotypicola TaxID=637393 RepID=A0ABN3DGL2_9MICO|nr:hypothetical protein [Herbiconiux moechotypicola]MCS5729476.1 hypothetical protein [Herbiconiux moechotypicola]
MAEPTVTVEQHVARLRADPARREKRYPWQGIAGTEHVEPAWNQLLRSIADYIDATRGSAVGYTAGRIALFELVRQTPPPPVLEIPDDLILTPEERASLDAPDNLSKGPIE